MSTFHIKVPKMTENGTEALTRNRLNVNTRINHKICYVCREEKHESLFGINNTRNDGLQTYCNSCAKEKQSSWYYKRVHGVTLQERDAMLLAQNKLCAICNNETEFQLKKGKHTNTGEFAVIDHCHDSKKIRGILCGHCNTGLGAFRDNPFYLEAAIKYLLKSGGE
jgi:hypothetical protein